MKKSLRIKPGQRQRRRLVILITSTILVAGGIALSVLIQTGRIDRIKAHESGNHLPVNYDNLPVVTEKSISAPLYRPTQQVQRSGIRFKTLKPESNVLISTGR